MSRIGVVVAALVMTAGAAGCGRSASPFATGTVQPVAGAVAVRVFNNSERDVDVYVVSGGVPSLMGTVTAASTASFVLDPSFVNYGDMRLVATPIGGNGRASSGQLLVSPGQTVQFQIQPRLRDSFATVR